MSAVLNVTKMNQYTVGSFNFKNNPEKCRHGCFMFSSNDKPVVAH